ncbi:Protein of unknown function (DUF2480) [Cyclonatronum proteinivorum]|uniref:DUF2480 family protein n=1 Tax=Cyclonatronum proteinivorum TaxID=1457365 RepID=A0A345UK52_9BACT|nr:DUF2480 family protein [Cyclonatronum proteinivorum]AXJ00854.1 Protein of unknown function (DUF2480) [Cyclonatronum proteinivorum]
MIENKVAKSGLITLDLEMFRGKTPVHAFDLKDYLYMELILREKDFREALQNLDWEPYSDSVIAVYCSADAIIAHWAYMLVCSHAQAVGAKVLYGTPEQVKLIIMLQNVRAHDWSQYDGRKVLLKGCSHEELDPSVYATATQLLLPYADRLMYGEACSFVPVYRKPKEKKVRQDAQPAG